MSYGNVYSRLFYAAYTTDNADHLIYQCPIGYVAILRDLQVWTSATDAHAISFLMNPGGVYFHSIIGVAATSFSWNGHLVIPAGFSVWTHNASGATLAYGIVASGYLLTAGGP